jgi:hypothetical protein
MKAGIVGGRNQGREAGHLRESACFAAQWPGSPDSAFAADRHERDLELLPARREAVGRCGEGITEARPADGDGISRAILRQSENAGSVSG